MSKNIQHPLVLETKTGTFPMSLLLAFLVLAQVGCSSGAGNRLQNMFGNFRVRLPSTVISTTPDETTAYGYNEGVTAGREYARQFGTGLTIDLNDLLPDVLRHADYGAGFESGCRNGINEYIRDSIKAVKQPAMVDIFDPDTSPRSVEPEERVVVEPIEPVAPPELPQATMTVESPATQPSPSPIDDKEVAASSDYLDLTNIGRLQMDSKPDPIIEESHGMPQSVLSEPAVIKIEPKPGTPIVENNQPNLDLEKVEQLFTESRPLKPVDLDIPSMDITPAPESGLNAEFQSREELQTEGGVEKPQPTQTTSISPAEEMILPKASPAAESVPALKNKARLITRESVNSHTGRPEIDFNARNNPAISGKRLLSSPKSNPAPAITASASQESKDDLVLSAVFVPFRSKPERMIESGSSSLFSKFKPDGSAIDGTDRNTNLQNRGKIVPEFQPAKNSPASQKQGSGVVVEHMDQVGIELNPVRSILATPFSNPGAGTGQPPRSTSNVRFRLPDSQTLRDAPSQQRPPVNAEGEKLPAVGPQLENLIEPRFKSMPAPQTPQLEPRQAGPETSGVYR